MFPTIFAQQTTIDFAAAADQINEAMQGVRVSPLTVIVLLVLAYIFRDKLREAWDSLFAKKPAPQPQYAPQPMPQGQQAPPQPRAKRYANGVTLPATINPAAIDPTYREPQYAPQHAPAPAKSLNELHADLIAAGFPPKAVTEFLLKNGESVLGGGSSKPAPAREAVIPVEE